MIANAFSLFSTAPANVSITFMMHDEPPYPHQYREITPFSRHCARLYLLEYLWNFSDTKEALEYIYEKFFSVDLSFHMSAFLSPNNDRVGRFRNAKRLP